MSNKVAILGSNSFSGAYFCDYMLSLGWEVFGMSRSVEPVEAFLPYKSNQNLNSFRFFQYDINHHLEQVIDLIRSEKIEFIVNFAAQSMVGQSWEYPEHWFMTNTVSTIKLHNELRKLDILEKYVHISTPEVYGNCEGLIQEHTDYKPSTPYAVSRAAADMSLMTFVNAYDFPVVLTRAANVFGSCQQLYRIVPKAVMSFLLNEKLPLHGGGVSVRSFIHMQDVCDGTYRVMMHGKPGDIFHFSTTHNISIRDLVEMVAQKMEINFEEHVEIVGDRLGKDSAYLLDSSKAIKELAWEPKISLEDGLDQTIIWARENFELLKSQPMNYIHKP